MKRSAFMMMAVVCLVLVGIAAAWADDARLTVTQDESSMEQTIERYLKASHDLIITEKTLAPDDMYLELPWKGAPMPQYRMTIDTQPLNKKDDGQVIERGIRLQVYTAVRIPEEKRSSALRVINDFNRDKVFAAVYLDSDNEVMLDWTLNVLSEGLATECVYDAVVREEQLWRDLYPQLAPLAQE